MKDILDGKRPTRPKDTTLLSDKIWDLIVKCWDAKPEKRLDMSAVRQELELASVDYDGNQGATPGAAERPVGGSGKRSSFLSKIISRLFRPSTPV